MVQCVCNMTCILRQLCETSASTQLQLALVTQRDTEVLMIMTDITGIDSMTANVSLLMYTMNHKKRDILFLTIILANLRNSTCNCSKIYHITLIVSTPYFVYVRKFK